jgi:hypothetical protein
MSTDGVIHSIVTDGATAVLRVSPELPLAALFTGATRDGLPTRIGSNRSATISVSTAELDRGAALATCPDSLGVRV